MGQSFINEKGYDNGKSNCVHLGDYGGRFIDCFCFAERERCELLAESYITVG
jgi:hypothetical protein